MQTAPVAPGAVLVRPALSRKDVMKILRGRKRVQKAPPLQNEADDAFFSMRTLSILEASTFIALLAGVSAGVTTGVGAAKTVGQSWAVCVGVLAGVVAALMTGLAVIGILHALVRK
jgi:lysylphosphatidylglycerol synthetase-like protein (DUF2156 family)